MPDLSKSQGRTDVQARPRTDSTVPGRRLDQAAPISVAANIRDSQRGNQAGQLREVLGMVDNATSSLVSLGQHSQMATETANAQVAAGDSVNGSVNPELMQRSTAYRMVIAGGRADSALATAEAEARQNVAQAVQASAYADPTKGDKVFGLEDANHIIEQTFRKHTLDEQGKPIDFGDPSANVRLYQGLSQGREHVLGVAAEAIRTQEQGKALDALSGSVVSGLLHGDTSAIETGMASAGKLGLDMKQTKSSFLSATLDAAMTSKSVDPITRALNSTKADGSSTWNPTEQASLMEAQMRMRNEFEAQHRREVETQFHHFAGEAALKVADGSLRLTPSFVHEAVESGHVDVQFAEQLLNLQHVHDEQKQQAISWGREAASYARTSQIQGMELESLTAKRQAQNFMGSALASGMNGQQLMGALIRNRARFSSEAWVDAVTFTKSLPTDQAYVTQAHAEDHLYELNNFLTAADKYRAQQAALGRRGYGEEAFTQKREGALYSFFSQLRLGANPDEALTKAISSTGADTKNAGYYVNAASARHAKNSPFDSKQLAKGP
jgi:hypothetical protein